MKKLLTIFLLSFSINGYCDWFKISSTDTLTSYIDDSKIIKKDKFVRVWTLYNLTKSRKLDNGMTYRSYINFTEIDCSEDKSRELSTTLYKDGMGSGDVIFTYEGSSKWSYSPPGSLGDSLIKFSCGLN